MINDNIEIILVVTILAALLLSIGYIVGVQSVDPKIVDFTEDCVECEECKVCQELTLKECSILARDYNEEIIDLNYYFKERR